MKDDSNGLNMLPVDSPEKASKLWSELELKQKITDILKVHQNLKSQKDIADLLSEEIKKSISQSTVSRLIDKMDPKPYRNDKRYWTLSEASYNEANLKKLEKLIEAGEVEDIPQFWGETAFAVLKTSPNYNSLVASQIAETFPSEVLTAFCPNDTDVLIFYRLRKKRTSDESMAQDSDSKEDMVSTEEISISEGGKKYRPSRLRKELRRICREVRERKSSNT